MELDSAAVDEDDNAEELADIEDEDSVEAKMANTFTLDQLLWSQIRTCRGRQTKVCPR